MHSVVRPFFFIETLNTLTMCVIVIKTKGSDFVPKDTIELCFKRNPHGFAFAWNEDGEIKNFRSMDMQASLAKYEELTSRLNPANTAFMVHARLATHGSQKIENCHCWVHGNIAFAHNGVLDIPSKDDMTDSEIFFRELFVPIMEALGMDFALTMARTFIGSSNNKFAIINGEGDVWITSGRQGFTKESFPGLKGKAYFSNMNWKPVSQFTSCLGFDPYEGVRKPVKAKASGSTYSGPASSVGPRKRPAPSSPLVVVRPDATLQERYDELPF